MNPDLPVVYLKSTNPEQRYRFLKDGELIEAGDTMIYKYEITEVRDGLNIIPNHEPWWSTVEGCKAHPSSESYCYLRPITLSLREVVLPLLDYWLGKYEPACTDEEERRIWQSVINTLTPKEPT